MFGLSLSEVAIILFIALVFIGPKKLPELAKGLGKGIREFQNAAKGIQDSIKNTENDSTTTKTVENSTTANTNEAEAEKEKQNTQV